MPIATGFVDYFPNAIAAVAALSLKANEQHHPGTPLHWDKAKSTDEADCLMRHFVERGTIDADGVRHSAKVAWRAMALLERELTGVAAGFEDVADDTGWIDHITDEQPVADDTLVEVMFNDGAISSARLARVWRWSKQGHSCDIEKYRVVK